MSILGWLFSILVSFALMLTGAIWQGYVLHILWGWFMTPVFSLPPLTMFQAVGVALVVGYLTKQSESGLKKDKNLKPYLMWYEMALNPALALLVGWIVKQFL